jgi:hypothetical protein
MAHSIRVVLVLVLLGFGLFVAGSPARAGDYRLVDVILLPTEADILFSFDISWFDSDSQRYYLADRNNAAIDVVNAQDHTFVGQIPGFVGFRPSPPFPASTSGANGILVIPSPVNQLWAGDGDSTVKVVDLTVGPVGTIIKTIDTGGTKRADELAYDPDDQLVVVANDKEPTPFLTFISTTDQTIVGQLPFPDATNGIEQPAYSPTTGRVYVAIPQTEANPGGEIAVLNPGAQTFEGAFPLPVNCIPHGLALGPHPFALVGCSASASPALPAGTPLISVILDLRDGDIAAFIPQVGGSDEVWYNPGDHRYYLGASGWTSTGVTGGPAFPVLGVIDALTNTWVENVPTVSGGGGTAHSVAVNARTDEIFLPLPDVGIGVYARIVPTP